MADPSAPTTSRERLLAILRREMPDRVPWIPRIELWHGAHRRAGTLPEPWRESSRREVERDLGLADPARDGRIYREIGAHEKTVAEADGVEITEVHTPVGSLRQVRTRSAELAAQGIGGVVTEHFLKTPSDFAAWRWIAEHRRYEPDYDAYRAYDASVGEDGLPLVHVEGAPFYHFLEALAGFENGYALLADYPVEVAGLIDVMNAVHRERLWPVIAGSPARLVMNGYHLGSQLTPPRLYREHLLPYYREANDLLRANGIFTAMHADDDTSAILDLIGESGWDLMDCFVTDPMARVTIEEARARWGGRVVIWGGLPACLFSPDYPEDRFRAQLERTLRAVAPGRAFILGIADNLMPGDDIERVRWVSEVMAERGACPLDHGLVLPR